MPTLQQAQSNKDMYLKQKVIVYVKEKFDAKIKNKEASIKISIEIDKDEED